jgi:hypothetical protein
MALDESGWGTPDQCENPPAESTERQARARLRR